jgi:uncharacterized protein (DUF1810 family)
MFPLDRFRQAQDGDPTFDEALRELRGGRKTSHWIWYVFPQLRGLGSSPMAVRYGLDGVGEASAYLQDPVLADRLARGAAAVRSQLEGGVRLDDLMGSEIDATKLVSSMTVFGAVARAEAARSPSSTVTALADDGEAILRAAEAQGYERCELTGAALAAARKAP